MIRLALDGTPLLGPRTGIGEVVAGLAAGARDAAPTSRSPRTRSPGAAATTCRGVVPPGCGRPPRRIPARFACGRRGCAPSIRASSGGPGRSTWCTRPTTSDRRPTGASVVSVYDLGFVRFPELVHRRRARSTRELLERAIARGAWIHATSDFVATRSSRRSRCRPSASCASTRACPPTQGGDAAAGRARSPAPTATCSFVGHHRAPQEPPRARAGVRRGRPTTTPTLALVVAGTPGWGADAFDAAARARHATRDRVHALGIRLRRRPARPARGRVGARVPVALRGLRLPAARGDGRRRAGRRQPRAAPSPRWSATPPLLVDPDDVDALADALQTRAARRRPAPRPRRTRARTRSTAFSWDADGRRARRALPPDRAREGGDHRRRAASSAGTSPRTSPPAASRSSSLDVGDTHAGRHHRPPTRWRAAHRRRAARRACTTSRRAATSASRGRDGDDAHAGQRRRHAAPCVDACVAAGVGRVLVVGSAEQYGAVDARRPPDRRVDTACRPITPYGETKVAAEAVALAAHREHGLAVVCTRAFNHTGPGQSPDVPGARPGRAHRRRGARRRRDEIALGNGDPVRDFSDVRDVVRAYALLVERGTAGRGLQRVLGPRRARRRPRRRADRTRRAARCASPPTTSSCAPVDVPVLVGDPTKLVADTGWAPEFDLDAHPRRRPRRRRA